MADIGIDQPAPQSRIGMRGIALPVEDRLLRRPHRIGREAELDERPDLLRQQRIIELVDLRPVIDDPRIRLAHRAEDIVEDVVEADVAEAELVDRGLELRLAVAADQRAREIRADRQVEGSIDRICGLGGIDDDAAFAPTGNGCRCSRQSAQRYDY
jgi:hypothetical protein